jgi:hypothetical protein
MVYSSHVLESLGSIEHSELLRRDDGGTGMSMSHFFFLQDLGILERRSCGGGSMFLLSHHFAVIQTVSFLWPLCHRHNNGSRRRLMLHTMLLLSISNLATLCSIAVAVPYIGSATIYLQHCRRASNDNDDYDGPVPAASSSSSTNCVAW